MMLLFTSLPYLRIIYYDAILPNDTILYFKNEIVSCLCLVGGGWFHFLVSLEGHK